MEEKEVIAIKLQIMNMIVSKADLWISCLTTPENLGYYTNLVYDSIIKDEKKHSEPFKVGDLIKHKSDKYGDGTIKVIEVKDDRYITDSCYSDKEIPFIDASEWEKKWNICNVKDKQSDESK